VSALAEAHKHSCTDGNWEGSIIEDYASGTAYAIAKVTHPTDSYLLLSVSFM
jgi:hypothetical protein